MSCEVGGEVSGGKVLDFTEYKAKGRQKGQGRYGYEDYPDAPEEYIEVDHKVSGDKCPCCGMGKLYRGEARKLLQFVGNAPVSVNRYKKASLRCNACGYEAMNTCKIKKWEDSARSAIALQKASGMPFYRLSGLQGLYNAPIAPSTLWKQCLDLWDDCGSFIYKELLAEASECQTLYIDDTKARILEIIKANKQLPRKERRGCNTTVICTTTKFNKKMVLYITANKYGGENVAPVVLNRSKPGHYLRIVCDASSRNTPVVGQEMLGKIIIANCMAHARRKFYELLEYYPEECQYFLHEISEIYKNDDQCSYYNDRKRLRYHKRYSSIHIRNIYQKITELFEQKLVEPNSGLGKAMTYLVRHKVKLTCFLRVKGIKLDNNISERELKGIILQRKNSLFFKSLSSAEVLSGLSSIIKTCAANNINAYAYLNWLQANWRQVEREPAYYLPWRYQERMNNTELIAA